MFRRLGNSWELIKASAAVLKADKELVVFPIVSAIGVLVVTASFALPVLLGGLFDALLGGRAQVFGVALGFAFYITQYFVIIFANSALVGAAMIRLRGGDPTVGDGFRVAAKHVPSILGYALISATVGMILRWISDRGRTLGRIASSILGMAWNIGTYLVVPVLVVEGVGPLEGIKRSVDLLRRTWGEQLIGNFGIGAASGLLIVLVIILGAAGIVFAVSADSAVAIALVVSALVLALVLLALLSSTLNGIYVAALYRYAADGEVSSYFDQAMVAEAFLPKN